MEAHTYEQPQTVEQQTCKDAQQDIITDNSKNDAVPGTETEGWEDETPFVDSFCTYVACLLLLAMGGMLAFAPLLLIPIGDVVSGIFGQNPENLPPPSGLSVEEYIAQGGSELGPDGKMLPRPSWAYYLFYGPSMAFLVLRLGISRHGLLCRRSTQDATEKGLAAFEARWQFKGWLWYPWALLVCEAAFLPYTVSYVLAPAGTPRRYIFLWGMPPAASTCSIAAFLAYRPREARSVMGFIEFLKVDVPNAAFAIAMTLPMLFQMVLGTMSFVPDWAGDILVPLFIIVLDIASERALPRICEAVARKNAWSSSYLEAGYDFQRRLLIEFGTTMILSTGCSYVEVASVAAMSCACLLWLDYKPLRASLHEGGQPEASALQQWSCLRVLCMRLPQEFYGEQRRLWVQHDPRKFEDARQWAREKANSHFAAMAAPIYYTAAVSIMHWVGPNKYDYYMFECYDDEHVLTTIQFAAYGFLWSFATMCLDVVAAHKMGIGAVLIYECNAQLYREFRSYLVTATFVGAIFTSCVFIKHDGIAVLQDFAAGVGSCEE